MGFKDYKIRDGVHIPTDKFRKNWNDIFGKKKKCKTHAEEKEKTGECCQSEEQEYLEELKNKI